MPEALLVNPYSAEDIADALGKALAMPRAERIQRWQALIKRVCEEDVMWWLRAFVAALEGRPIQIGHRDAHEGPQAEGEGLNDNAA